MALYRLTGTRELSAPVLIAALDGWIDASGAASASVDDLGRHGELVASFDGDALLDYRARRPVLDVVDGALKRLEWAELELRHSRLDGRDLLILAGPEPDLRWRELCEDVADLAVRLGVAQWVSLGAIPAAVPHTRPVSVLATASEPGLLRHGENQGPGGLLRVPAAALSVMELSVEARGIPTVGFYAQVPHYVAGPYTEATVALLEHVGRHLDTAIATAHLDDDVRNQRARFDSLVAAQPEAQAYLERLESLPGPERIPSGDEIAREFERLLRQGPEDDGGGGRSGPGPFEER